MDRDHVIILALSLPLFVMTLALITVCWVRYMDSPTSLRRLGRKLRRAKRIARQRGAHVGETDNLQSPEVQLSERLSEQLGGDIGASCDSLEELQAHDVQLELAPDLDQEELDAAVLAEVRAASVPQPNVVVALRS